MITNKNATNSNKTSAEKEIHDPKNSSVAKIIGWSIKNQLLVLIGTIALIVAGWM